MPEVVLTDKCRSKCHRLLTQEEVKQFVEELDGDLFKERQSSTYHLLTNPERLHCTVVILFSVKESGKRVVITQMHDHGVRYNQNLEEVDDLED